MFIINTLLLIIGLALVAYTAIGVKKFKNYTFKSAKIRKQQSMLMLIGFVGVLLVLFAFILFKT